MKCPKCGSQLRISNTFEAGDYARTHKHECTNTKCNCIVTSQTVIVTIDPERGEGAAALAKRLANSSSKGTQP